MRTSPRWFLKALKLIDPTYYVEYDKNTETFDIKRRAIKLIDGERQEIALVVECFLYLNESALTHLRCRKHLGKHLFTEYDSVDARRIKHVKWMKRKEMEDRKKARDEALDMQVEGWRKMYKLATSKTYDMGGRA